MTTPPVLLLWFNRPDLARRQIEALRAVRPPSLYLAADGPRSDRPDEAPLCVQTREVLREIDWPCEVRTLFRSENRGVRRAVAEALDWFFASEESGVVLEDDCLPAPGFFPFAAEALERYREDPRVLHVSGTSFLPSGFPSTGEWRFSRYACVWGWATWRRAWRKYRAGFEGLEEFHRRADRQGFWSGRHERSYWRKIFGWNVSGRVESWAYRWNYTLWAENGLAVTPAENLVSNVGFDGRATNTVSGDDDRAARPWGLDAGRAPAGVFRDAAADRWIFRHLYWGTPGARLAHRLHQVRQLAAAVLRPAKPAVQASGEAHPEAAPSAG